MYFTKYDKENNTVRVRKAGVDEDKCIFFFTVFTVPPPPSQLHRAF